MNKPYQLYIFKRIANNNKNNNIKLQTTNYKLRATNYKLKTMNYKLQADERNVSIEYIKASSVQYQKRNRKKHNTWISTSEGELSCSDYNLANPVLQTFLHKLVREYENNYGF